MKSRGISFFLLLISINLVAQPVKPYPENEILFDLPVIDLPYQLDAARTVGDGAVTFGSYLGGYANPGMPLSLSVSADLYTATHWGIKSIFKIDKNLSWRSPKRFWNAVLLVGSDFILEYIPGFDGWEHEEYHRAVLSRFHVNSFNDILKFPVGAELVNVSHVKDEDLARFKLASPSDFVRSEEAGIEGEYLLIDRLQRNNFFYNQQLPHELFYWLTTLNSIFYVTSCSDPKEADIMTDEANAKETTIESRDFTGLDFLSWTYDLFRPLEPYADRGIHPSGTGIDRYIKTTDLTSQELTYLKNQGKLQWLNVVSPMLIGIRRIRLTDKGLYGNFALRDYLTSFGNDISVNVFLMKEKYRFVFALHNFRNYNSYFPALEGQMTDYPVEIISKQFYLSPRLIAGVQPLNQDFMTGNAAFLGLAECRVELVTGSHVNPYIEFSAKTRGWIPGNAYLDDNLSFRIGITSRFSVTRESGSL